MRIIILVVLFNIIPIISSLAQDYAAQKKITEEVVGYFEDGKYADIYALFDETMKSSISTEKLGEIWSSLPVQCGKYIGAGDAIASEVQGYVVVNHYLDFENVDLDLRLAFNANNQISGLFFVPPVKKKE